jgi:glycosyltransferase involved in cell wall biosynthesis
MRPSNTVIVATFNSASDAPFGECLASIRQQQTESPIRLIVVDGGSSDATLDMARASNAEIVENPATSELGFSGGKNLALGLVDSEFVTMIDADNILIEKDYLERMTRPLLANPGIDVAVPNPYVPPPGKAPSITRYFCLRERDYWIDLSRDGRTRGGWIEFRPVTAIIPNAGVMRSSALRNIGGWDYDTEVASRLITRGRGIFALVPDAHRFHQEVTTYREVIRKFSRRISNQFENHSNKATVAKELSNSVRQPLLTVKREVVRPVVDGLRMGDWAYLHSVPVSGLKAFLTVERWGRRNREQN